MKGKSIILEFIIFIIVGVFILQVLTYIFVPKFIEQQDPAGARIKGFYNEKNNIFDVIFIGNSESSRAYSPICIWNKYGIISYNYSSSLQTVEIAYYKLKETLKYQKPKVVVLEVNSFFDIGSSTDEAYRRVIDNWKFDTVKLEAIFDKSIKLENRLSYVFPILRYHSRWNELDANDFKKLTTEYKKIAYKGFPMIASKKTYQGDLNYMQKIDKTVDIPEENMSYIDKIITLCNEKNIKVILAEVPVPNIWSLEKNNRILKLANKYGLEFIDFNMLQEKINIDWSCDTYDSGNHLNIYGAEKVSNYIGKILSEKYNIPNHKNDANIADEWNEEAQRYEQHKKELELKLEQNSKK